MKALDCSPLDVLMCASLHKLLSYKRRSKVQYLLRHLVSCVMGIFHLANGLFWKEVKAH